MILNKENALREQFKSFLYELASSQMELQDKRKKAEIYVRLENLYESETDSGDDKFRHFYSDIFEVLTQICQNPELGAVEILGQNLEIIRAGYQPLNPRADGTTVNISNQLNKLYDHVSLDIARLSYTSSGDREASGKKSIRELNQKIDLSVKTTAERQKEIEEKINNQQREYIAILGIFAAVVLAFTGGLAFSSSVLNNIAEVSFYKLSIIALIIGLVLTNVLFGLFYYIDKLVNKDKKVAPLIISNVVIVVLILAIIVLKFFEFDI